MPHPSRHKSTANRTRGAQRSACSRPMERTLTGHFAAVNHMQRGYCAAHACDIARNKRVIVEEGDHEGRGIEDLSEEKVSKVQIGSMIRARLGCGAAAGTAWVWCR